MTTEAPTATDDARLPENDASRPAGEAARLFDEGNEQAFADTEMMGEESLDASPPRRRTSMLPSFDFAFLALLLVSSISFFAVAVTIAYQDPEYFQKRLIASLLRDNSEAASTGALRGAAGSAMPGIDGLPAEMVVRDRPLTPSDYEIVMVYGGEAILATKEELMRVKVGSSVPGLGQVKSILPSETGGTVLAEEATLRSVAN